MDAVTIAAAKYFLQNPDEVFLEVSTGREVTRKFMKTPDGLEEVGKEVT